MVIILSTSLWLHQLLSSWWWPSHPLTMLGTGRHSLWNICRQWKTTMLKGFAASRGRGQGREKSSGQQQFHFPARSCPGRIANLQSHPSQAAWLNTGQAWVLLLWGPRLDAWLPNQLLQLHTGDYFIARQQHLLLKKKKKISMWMWLHKVLPPPALCTQSWYTTYWSGFCGLYGCFLPESICVCQDPSLTSGQSWANILGVTLPCALSPLGHCTSSAPARCSQLSSGKI